MGLIDFLQAIIIFAGGVVSISFIKLASAIYKADPVDYEINRSLSGRWLDTVMGRVRPRYHGDGRVKTGLAIDKRTNTWVLTGRLSDEAIDRILR